MVVRTHRHSDTVTSDASVLPRPLSGPTVAEPAMVDRLARWLLLAVAADLLVTRFVVRLALLVPKGEPWASASAIVGRIGAAVDALVPIVGVLLLGALMVRAARTGDAVGQAMAVAIGVVALVGVLSPVLTPSPVLVVIVESLVVLVVVAAAARSRHRASRSPLGVLGLVALAGAMALTASGTAIEALGIRPSGPEAAGVGGLALHAAGQAAFVLGAALLGLGGLMVDRARRVPTRHLAFGIGVALLVMLAWMSAPASWDALMIWSIGLGGAIPVPVIAVALGLAAAGLPGLRHHDARLAFGSSIVLLAGSGLAASGLLFAGLLGLALATTTADASRGIVRPRDSA